MGRQSVWAYLFLRRQAPGGNKPPPTSPTIFSNLLMWMAGQTQTSSAFKLLLKCAQPVLLLVLLGNGSFVTLGLGVSSDWFPWDLD